MPKSFITCKIRSNHQVSRNMKAVFWCLRGALRIVGRTALRTEKRERIISTKLYCHFLHSKYSGAFWLCFIIPWYVWCTLFVKAVCTVEIRAIVKSINWGVLCIVTSTWPELSLNVFLWWSCRSFRRGQYGAEVQGGQILCAHMLQVVVLMSWKASYLCCLGRQFSSFIARIKMSFRTRFHTRIWLQCSVIYY